MFNEIRLIFYILCMYCWLFLAIQKVVFCGVSEKSVFHLKTKRTSKTLALLNAVSPLLLCYFSKSGRRRFVRS